KCRSFSYDLRRNTSLSITQDPLYLKHPSHIALRQYRGLHIECAHPRDIACLTNPSIYCMPVRESRRSLCRPHLSGSFMSLGSRARDSKRKILGSSTNA
ncbi:unnamed protein product, partial [Mycena citricolor]